MKIRNIESYIQKRLSRHNWNVDKKKIGSDNEPFLLATFGDEQKVDNLFKRVSEIATNAEEQIFYELVQNAHDVHATSLYFYVSEDYLLVINNGNVFKTDDEDSLFNFLAFNKSDKSDEKGDWGEKGIGAKTMYTLISDVEDSKKSFDLLHKAIKEDRKGPYLISWNNRNQLDCLLQNRTGWEATEDNDALLFIKIILCYYPMIPKNEEYNYFKVEEAEKVVRILNEGIKPIGNIAFLEQGTALIVPLGKNKYNERIRSRETDIRENLGLFQCFDSSKQDIQYCQEIIHRENVKERDIKWNDNGAVHEYKFVFNKAFADKKICNLFKDLPINETKSGLGFVINSKDFDLDGSRQ